MMNNKDVAKKSNGQRKIEAVNTDVDVKEMHEEGASEESDVVRHRIKKSIGNKVEQKGRMCNKADSVVGQEESVYGSKTI